MNDKPISMEEESIASLARCVIYSLLATD